MFDRFGAGAVSNAEFLGSMPFVSTKNGSVEEQFIWLLNFATVKQIKEFLSEHPAMNLHYTATNLKTPLTAVIDRGDPQIVATLLDKNPTSLDETSTQPCARTALLFYASFTSRTPEMLQLLLKKGADVHKLDARGWTCLQHAIVGERLKNVAFLLDNEAVVNQRDFQERTPLMIAVYLSSLEILSLLLDRGGEVNARDKNGLTALQLAVLWRKRDAAILLIENGSDLSVVTALTRTPLGRLCRTTMPNVLRCIEEERRKIN